MRVFSDNSSTHRAALFATNVPQIFWARRARLEKPRYYGHLREVWCPGRESNPDLRFRRPP